jgi:uncharacterized protein (DUF2336 family)
MSTLPPPPHDDDDAATEATGRGPHAASAYLSELEASLDQLRRESSTKVRGKIADRLGVAYQHYKLSADERAIAEQIFRLLMQDTEIQVRAALSESLKQSQDLPHDIALKLAKDIADVATPILRYSMVLTEEDLVEIVRSTRTVAIMNAIAQRQTVSAELSDALLARNEEEVLQHLFSNAGAVMRESTLEPLLESLKNNDGLLQLLVERGDMSLQLAERLFAMASDEIKEMLTERYNLTLHVAEENAEDVFELMTLGLISPDTKAESLEGLVEHLYATNRLTFSLIVRILCAGKLRFFEHVMARLAQVPLLNARILILDPGPHGFKSLYDQSGLPQGFYPAVKALLEVALEETHHGRYERRDYPQRMVEHLAAKGYDRKIDYLDYLTMVVKKQIHDVPGRHYV